MRAATAEMMQRFDVRPRDLRLPSAKFSGGNQQKLVLAREIDVGPKVLLVGQPTRGVDIGAIEFINQQLVALKRAGCAILLVSVELDEILALADRKEYLNEEVFDYWASLQSTYPFRFKDIVKDDPVLSELHLRRNFSALFLYGQAANKGGIATAVVRWSL